MLGKFSLFCHLRIVFPKSFILKNSFRINIRVAPHCIEADLGPNCLQRLSADTTSRQSKNRHNLVKVGIIFRKVNCARVHSLSRWSEYWTCIGCGPGFIPSQCALVSAMPCTVKPVLLSSHLKIDKQRS